MEQGLVDLALKDGIFALLFVALFLYQLRESKSRENRLMNFIDEITEKFETLSKQYERLSEDVRSIRDGISSRRQSRKKEGE